MSYVTQASIPEYVFYLLFSTLSINSLILTCYDFWDFQPPCYSYNLYRVLERHPGASLQDRTAILSHINDLGPPDLVNLTKIIGTPTKNSTAASLQTTGTYLYYTGADTSNVATIAALLNSLAMIIGQEQQLWFGKLKPFHVSHATYSTYNAFRKLDLRVNVAFPGSVSWEVLDAYGNQASSDLIPENEVDDMWIECFISSIVRSLITADDDGDFSSIVEIRRINPFLDSNISIPEFLNGFKKLFLEGEKLGCNENIQVPNTLNNHLIDAFFKCIELTHCYDLALKVLYELYKSHNEVATLIAKTLFLADRELEAVKFIHDKLSLSKNVNEIPGSSTLLLLQSEYCLNKSRPDLALPLAIKSVESAPSMFAPWAHLVKVYIALNKFDEALLTLNACPMVTHKDKYILKRIALGVAKKINDVSNNSSSNTNDSNIPLSNEMHLPLPQDVFLRGVTDLNSLDVANEHSKLLSSQANPNNKRLSIDKNSISPQSLLALPAASLKSTFRSAYSLLAEIVLKIGWEGMLNIRSKVFVMEEEWNGGNNSNNRLNVNLANNNKKSVESTSELNGEFRKKRLCERWLDNLFMLLYEDMKVYTLCRAQEMQAESMTDSLSSNEPTSANKSLSISETLGLWGGARNSSNDLINNNNNNNNNNNKYPKIDPYTESRSCLEWELIGLVSERLGHIRDAQRCYERALAKRFSVRAAKKLIGIYSRWRDRARIQIGIQGKLQYASQYSNKQGLLGQSKWNTSTMTINGNVSGNGNINNNEQLNLNETLHANSSMLSISKIPTSTNYNVHVRDPMRYDPALLRLLVGLLVWDYRWYTMFSPLLLDTLANIVNDMGVTKTESEVRVWFDDIQGNRGIFDIVNMSINVLQSWKRIEVDNE
jgi:hypothetical protein